MGFHIHQAARRRRLERAVALAVADLEDLLGTDDGAATDRRSAPTATTPPARN